MTAAGCDYVSDGRFVLGLGASGPQVIEGFHGVQVRQADAAHQGVHRGVPHDLEARGEVRLSRARRSRRHCPPAREPGLGKPLKLINHPVRSEIPIWWASLKGLSVTATAEIADGWLPIMFIPEKYQQVWGDQLKAGSPKRDPSRARLDISAGGMLAIGEDLVGEKQTAILDVARPNMALYVGGMGARGKNFYNDICRDVRLRAGGRRHPGPVPRRQEGRGCGACAGRVAGAVEPRRAGRLHQGSSRRLQGSRRHGVVGQSGRARRRAPDRDACGRSSTTPESPIPSSA